MKKYILSIALLALAFTVKAQTPVIDTLSKGIVAVRIVPVKASFQDTANSVFLGAYVVSDNLKNSATFYWALMLPVKDSVIYLSPNSTNTIVVTWTQRASTGDRYILRLTNIAKNATTDFTLLKSANLSSYTNRYDKFSIVVGSLETGSYKYEVYDTSSTVGAAVAVVETGLAYVQVVSLTFNTFANSIQYTVFGASDERVFDSTNFQ